MKKTIKGNFRWRYDNTRLYLDYYIEVNGKFVRKRPLFATVTIGSVKERKELEKAASKKLDHLLRESQNPLLFENPPEFPTYKQIAHFYWDKKGSVKEFHKKAFHSSPDFGKLKKSIAYFGDMDSNKITRFDVKEYRKMLAQNKNQKTGEPLRNSYINRLVAIVGQVYHFCVSQEEFIYAKLPEFEQEKYGNIDILTHLENPIKGLPRKTEIKNKPYVPTRKEFVRFWKELKPAIQYLAITEIHTGLRKRNVLELKWEHVDIFKGYIEIPTYKGSNNGPPLIHKMSSELHQMMKLLCKHRGENVYVHVKNNGEPFSDFSRAWSTALKNADVPHFSFRALRTAYATWSVENNVTIGLLQKALGHTTTQTTSEFYNESKMATTIIAKDQPALLPSGTFG